MKKEIVSLQDSLKKTKSKSLPEINKIKAELSEKKRLHRLLPKPRLTKKPKPQPKIAASSDEEPPMFKPKPKTLPIPKQGKPISKNKYKKLLAESKETGLPMDELIKKAQHEHQSPPPTKDRSKDIWSKREKRKDAVNQAVFNPGYKSRLSKIKNIRK